MADPMVGALLMFWLIAAAVSIVALLDWLGRRKDRRAKDRPGAPVG